ncbi:hypothetical protein [Aquibium microcysteis]|uniref:hypothetical protein n=1 Tax=Aquibium microcysteis TaxID=675281 RepID=UPI00165D0ACD|nr:hypothetical protein [Aquibium microcysteis]
MTAISGTPLYLRTPDIDGRILNDAMREEASTLSASSPFDGVTKLLTGRPNDFGDPATATHLPSGFRYWHTAHQLEWLKAYQGAGASTLSVTDGGNSISTLAVSLPYGSDGGETMHVLLTSGLNGAVPGEKLGVTILNDLLPDRLQRMSLDDQRLVASHPAFGGLLAGPFGLRPSVGETVTQARAAMSATLQALRDLITNSPALPPSDDPEQPTNPAQLILDQIDLALANLDRMGVFNPATIEDLRAQLAAQYERLERYGAALRGFTAPETATTGFMSTDNRAGLRGAYEIFVQSSARMLDVARATAEVVSTGRFNGKILDVAGMTFTFQVLANYQGEAEMQARTEEIRVRNALLANYSVMQQLVNRTSAAIPAPPKADDGVVDPPEGGLVYDTDSATRALEEKVLSMFLSNSSVTAAPHPSELQLGVTRPPLSETSLTKGEWDTFGTVLSGAVRVLDRDVQSLSDQVNAISRERNRHFDMATEVMQKMTSIVSEISAGIN